jgi:hypothetical protein
MEWGRGGGYHCPLCNGPVRIVQAYRLPITILSLVLPAGFLAVVGVHSAVGLVILSCVIWIPLSLALNATASRFKPLSLTKRRSGSDPRDYQLFDNSQRNVASSSATHTSEDEIVQPQATDKI